MRVGCHLLIPLLALLGLAPATAGAGVYNGEEDLLVASTFVGDCQTTGNQMATIESSHTAAVEAMAYDNGSTQGDMYVVAWQDTYGDVLARVYDTRTGWLVNTTDLGSFDWSLNAAGHSNSCFDGSTTWTQGCAWLTAATGGVSSTVGVIQAANHGSGQFGYHTFWEASGRWPASDVGICTCR